MSTRLHLTAIGLGPGDPELITLKGLRALERADLVFVPRQRSSDSLALDIAKCWINEKKQQVIALSLAMTHDTDQALQAWQLAADTIAVEMNTLAANDLRQEVHAVYVLLGDPLLYGTFTYIAMQLAQRHPQIVVEIIPGITSFAALAAQVKLPLGLTHDRVVILPASYETDIDKLRHLLINFETIILMKVGPVLPQILNALDELGMLKNALYAEKVGMPDERIVEDVRTLARTPGPYFSLLIVRKEYQ